MLTAIRKFMILGGIELHQFLPRTVIASEELCNGNTYQCIAKDGEDNRQPASNNIPPAFIPLYFLSRELGNIGK